MSDPVLAVKELSVQLWSGSPIVEDVSFAVEQGQILGLVGESGSGKTTTALALLGFARPGARIANGSVRIASEEILGRPENEVRRLRGRVASYVPQDPSSSLNPSIRIGDQLAKMLRAHVAEPNVKREVTATLTRVHLPADPDFQRRFPHQLSGGQQQRVTIAIALICGPPLVVMDEPTTGLDVVTQARILQEIDRLRQELGVAIVYVSHNLAVVGSIADLIAVMYAGRIIEFGPAQKLLQSPRHPYTRGLLSSVPDHAVPRRLHGIPGIAVGVGERPRGCAFTPRCPQRTPRCAESMPELEEVDGLHQARCFEWRRTPPLVLEAPLEPSETAFSPTPLLTVDSLQAHYRTRRADVVAAEDVSFAVHRGETLALVGESGSGKTTIARCIAGLHTPTAGRILLANDLLAPRARARPREARRRIQIVFQNPYDSLNPRRTIAEAIARPARFLRGLSPGDARADAFELLERVRLPMRLGERYPRELSGGERQRAAIARALAARPELLICDEVTSALDVSVQAVVLELLAELRIDLGLTLIFISHDLGVVASVCDRVLVLEHGVVREQGRVSDVLTTPSDAYTRTLIDSAPRLPTAVIANQ